jgi:hypothetical protein
MPGCVIYLTYLRPLHTNTRKDHTRAESLVPYFLYLSWVKLLDVVTLVGLYYEMQGDPAWGKFSLIFCENQASDIL